MTEPLDIEIFTGETVTITLRIKESGVPIDVSTRTYAAQVRQMPKSTTILATFSVDMTNAATGVVVLTLSAATTAALDVTHAVWDVKETNAGVVSRVHGGQAVIKQMVTR